MFDLGVRLLCLWYLPIRLETWVVKGSWRKIYSQSKVSCAEIPPPTLKLRIQPLTASSAKLAYYDTCDHGTFLLSLRHLISYPAIIANLQGSLGKVYAFSQILLAELPFSLKCPVRNI